MSAGTPQDGTIIARALGAFAAVNMAMLTGLTLYLVIARDLLHTDAGWAQELGILCAIQAYMTGALIAASRRAQINIDWLEQRLEAGRAARLHQAVVAIVVIVVTLFFCYWAWEMLAWNMNRPQVTPALGLPLWIFQISILLCAIGCTGYAIRDLVQAIGFTKETLE
ncbi:hypothetical protein NBRC116599_01350 [Aquicoccus sp. SU-CL01552]